MPGQVKSENINSFFFDGHYKEIWRQFFPEKTTLAEVDWIANEAKLDTGDHVLDLMCGYGRHSIQLARKGMHVTAVDNLPGYVEEIKDVTSIEKLPLDAICEDVLKMRMEKEYDAVICMGNSLQFFNERDTMELLSNISSHLKRGGKFFINTWSIGEIAFKNFKENSWSTVGDLLLLSECKFLFHPTRMEINSIMITKEGQREEKRGVDYIYSINELELMLNKTGFQLKEIYSIPGKKLFTVGEPRAYIVAEKISS